MKIRRAWPAILFLLLLLPPAIVLDAQQNTIPGQLENVKIEQLLNKQVPLEMPFIDETGRAVRLQNYFTTKPVVLILAYYKCPMLCPYVLTGLSGSLKAISFEPGEEFEVVVVSFDPTDTAQLAEAAKQEALKSYGKPQTASGWHFLTGSQNSIDRLTRAVGFSYEYDTKQQQYAHASALMILTPEGRLSRYFYGIEYPPRDLRLALVEASENKIGNAVDQVLLFCFHYDPSTGKYSAAAINLIRVGAILTVCVLGIFILRNVKQKKGE